MTDTDKLIAAIDAATAAITSAVNELKTLSAQTGRANSLAAKANPPDHTWLNITRRGGK